MPEDSKKRLVLFVVCLLFFIALAAWLSAQGNILIRSDHFSRWYAVYKLLAEGRSLYDPRNGAEIVALNSIPTAPVEGSFFYPAYLMLFIVPVARLPYPLAHFIWLVTIQLFLLLGLWLTARQTGWPERVSGFTVLIGLSVVFIPSLQHTIWGQFNTIGVISLALTYAALRAGRYGLAGVAAAGLTFKPQVMLLTLAGLLVWAALTRLRWRFYLGFGLSVLGLWAGAELLEPGWVPHFLAGVQAYAAYLHPLSTFDQIWPTHGVLAGALGLGALALFVYNRRSAPATPQFLGCLALSLGVWWGAVPVLGMLHLVALPLALIFLFSGLRQTYPRLYRYGIPIFLILYGLGLAGFIGGLANPAWYGWHIRLAELAYKTAAVLTLIALAIPLCLKRQSVELSAK